MACGQDLRFRVGIPAGVVVLVLINICNEYVVEALAVIPVKEMTKVFHVSFFAILGNYSVPDVVMPLVNGLGLGLNQVLNLTQVIRMNHSFKGAAYIVI